MDLFFLVIYLAFAIVLVVQSYLKILYIVQSSGYLYRSVWQVYLLELKKYYAIWILYLVTAIALLIINPKNIFLLTALLILSSAILILLGDRFKGAKLLKYTKRIFRILTLSIILLGGYLTLTIFVFDNLIKVVLLPAILLINYIVLATSLVALSPIEKMIKLNYERKTKLKLLGMKNLIKIGITGSYGKTSTKEILTTIISTQFYTCATPKSYNTPMGITKAVLNGLSGLHEVFVCEMGAKKVGEIKELCKLTSVDYGIVTAVGRQHTSTFGSIQNIYRTKKELPDYLTNKSCVFNLNNSYTYKMYLNYSGNKIGVFVLNKIDLTGVKFLFKKRYINIKKCHVNDKKYILVDNIKYNNVYAKGLKLSSKGSEFDVFYDKKFVCHASTILVGKHNVTNILLSVAMAKMLGVTDENICLGIAKLKPINARLEKYESKNGAIILNNGYNSNIDTLNSSLEAIKLFNKPNVLVVTPGVIECKDEYNINRQFGEKISKVATEVIIVKNVNRDALYSGLILGGFDAKKIYFAGKFSQVKNVLNNLSDEYVVLIENDLPESFS